MRELEEFLNKNGWKAWITVIGIVCHGFGVAVFWGHTNQHVSITVLLLLNIVLLGGAAFYRKKAKLAFFLSSLSLLIAVWTIHISGLSPLEVSYLAFSAVVAVALIQRTPYMPLLFGLTMAGSYYSGNPANTLNLTMAIGSLYTGTSLALFLFLSRKLYQELNKYYVKSITDSLTQAYSFGHTMEVGQRLLNRGEEIDLFLIDVNDFKTINDQYGHLAGNEALVYIAGLLTEMTEEKACVGRLGGDEFIILAKEGKIDEEFAEKLQEKFRSHPFASVHTIHDMEIMISIGNVSSRLHNVNEMHELLHIADMEMYEEKKRGKMKKGS